jgi:hypothetical protein
MEQMTLDFECQRCEDPISYDQLIEGSGFCKHCDWFLTTNKEFLSHYGAMKDEHNDARS